MKEKATRKGAKPQKTAVFSPSQFGQRPLHQLLIAVTRFQELCASVHIPITPYTSASEAIALGLPPNQLLQITQGFISYVGLLEAVKERGVDLLDNKQLSWAALQILKVFPTNDFFDRVHSNDIVECYDMNHIQNFRTLRFFELCSYDVLSILTRPWHDLYGRDEKLHEDGVKEMIDSLTNSFTTKEFNMPPHFLWEKSSEEKRSFKMTHKVRAPLFFRDTKPHRTRAGIIMTSEALRVL